MEKIVEADTLQGIIDDSVWFHLDIRNDVLYLRDPKTISCPVFGEETPSGSTLLRSESGAVAGMTFTDYWKQFGSGILSANSISAVQENVANCSRTIFAGYRIS